MTLEAPHYEAARQRFMADPIVIKMAEGITLEDRDFVMHDDGAPIFDFMLSANAEYRRRGGQDAAHIGAIAEAILRLKGWT